MSIEEFSKVREWGKIRGLDKSNFHSQFQKLMQETAEIHEAYIENDMLEVKDAIGDSIVVLINLATSVGVEAEDCLEEAFKVIELRKGLTKGGNFVRYTKLSNLEKAICDTYQGNFNEEYFLKEEKLKAEDFVLCQ